jgi:hypothetical protein
MTTSLIETNDSSLATISGKESLFPNNETTRERNYPRPRVCVTNTTNNTENIRIRYIHGQNNYTLVSSDSIVPGSTHCWDAYAPISRLLLLSTTKPVIPIEAILEHDLQNMCPAHALETQTFQLNFDINHCNQLRCNAATMCVATEI